ncbi:hypothetical protein CT19425_U340014 [Cupriavidus taiwanensis]|uniref:Uncharacterized protein n=1 Tax=Cupriavidus taiwanensis TaxID=164546 RepID=A0A375I7E8_9BURK|nr:hypothetical protein CT19425_U340014 [Cupriavidus taiwanensis]
MPRDGLCHSTEGSQIADTRQSLSYERLFACAECLPHLFGTLKFVAVQVHGRGGDRRVAQVVTHGGEFSQAGVTVSHPGGRCTAQFLRSHWVIGIDRVGGLRKEAP